MSGDELVEYSRSESHDCVLVHEPHLVGGGEVGFSRTRNPNCPAPVRGRHDRGLHLANRVSFRRYNKWRLQTDIPWQDDALQGCGCQ